jgi:hypothetical protein
LSVANTLISRMHAQNILLQKSLALLILEAVIYSIAAL